MAASTSTTGTISATALHHYRGLNSLDTPSCPEWCEADHEKEGLGSAHFGPTFGTTTPVAYVHQLDGEDVLRADVDRINASNDYGLTAAELRTRAEHLIKAAEWMEVRSFDVVFVGSLPEPNYRLTRRAGQVPLVEVEWEGVKVDALAELGLELGVSPVIVGAKITGARR